MIIRFFLVSMFSLLAACSQQPNEVTAMVATEDHLVPIGNCAGRQIRALKGSVIDNCVDDVSGFPDAYWAQVALITGGYCTLSNAPLKLSDGGRWCTTSARID